MRCAVWVRGSGLPALLLQSMRNVFVQWGETALIESCTVYLHHSSRLFIFFTPLLLYLILISLVCFESVPLCVSSLGIEACSC